MTEKHEGPISVEADITPITRQPIDKVEPLKWSNMSSTQLCEQRAILWRRQAMALQVGMISTAQQIQRGIETLNALIDLKGSDEMGFL